MAKVRLTRHLFTFFPDLEHRQLALEGRSVAEVVESLERVAPGIAFYICDERGRLRHHVNIFLDEEPLRDRHRLSDEVGADTEIFIAQALSGG